MNSIIPILKPKSPPHHVAIFLSGNGSNAENMIRDWQRNGEWENFRVVLFTDRPETSKARMLAKRYGLELIENDIRKFYQRNGENKVSVSSARGFRIREEWTRNIRAQLDPYTIDFGIFAGFIPLTNLTSSFPCLNIHPGDLTYLKQGKRYLIGLHTIPIERAILERLTYLRSSVILVKPYNPLKKNMDDGILLGISEKVAIDLDRKPFSFFQEIACSRIEKRPRKGFKDELERVASKNQEHLKKFGDWIVFPKVIAEFAKGNYGLSEREELFFRENGNWIRIKTIIFGENSKRILQENGTLNRDESKCN